MIEGADEHLSICRDRPHPFGDQRPAPVDPVVHGVDDVILAQIAHHFELCGHREERLCSHQIIETQGQPLLGRAVKPVAIKIRAGQPAIMKKDRNRPVPEVPERRRVARDAFADAVRTDPGRARRPNANAPLANAKRQAISAGMVVVMAGSAGDVFVAREDFVVEQKLSDAGLIRVCGDVILWSDPLSAGETNTRT